MTHFQSANSQTRENCLLDHGHSVICGEPVPFERRVIHQRYHLFVPYNFTEDQTIRHNYTYLYNQSKTPLSIAVKASPVATEADRAKQIGVYFNQSHDSLDRFEGMAGTVFLRDMVTKSDYLSIYTLRFAVATMDHILFGCFNCSAVEREDWRKAVISMLQSIEGI